MLKISKYLKTIAIIYKERALTLVFSTRSGAFRIMNTEMWKTIENKNFNKVPIYLLSDLIEMNYLVEEQEDEVKSVLDENKLDIASSKDLYVVIQPTANCPLGCHYCGQSHTSKLMTSEHQAATLNRIGNKLKTGKFDKLFISWFGAEPLSGMTILNQLSPRLKLVAQQYNVGYSAAIVTNGLLLSQSTIEKLVQDHSIKKFEITLDGVDEVHDQRRHLKNGGPSFQRIYDNLLNLCRITSNDIGVVVRCNVDARNKSNIDLLIEKLVNDNLQNRISLYFAPIHSWGNNAHLLAAETAEFSSWEIDWFIKMKDLGFKINVLPSRKKSICMAVNPNSELVDPFGGVYNCTEVSLVPSYEKDGENIHLLGTVSESNLRHQERWNRLGDFYEYDRLKDLPCYSCTMLPTCGGRCPKEWAEGREPCPPTKFNIEDRMLLNFYWNLDHLNFSPTDKAV
jgi:uncharacterized protein